MQRCFETRTLKHDRVNVATSLKTEDHVSINETQAFGNPSAVWALRQAMRDMSNLVQIELVFNSFLETQVLEDCLLLGYPALSASWILF